MEPGLWCLCRVSYRFGRVPTLNETKHLLRFKRRLGWKREAGEFDGMTGRL